MGQFLLYFLAGLILVRIVFRLVKAGVADAMRERDAPPAAKKPPDPKTVRMVQYFLLMLLIVVIGFGVPIILVLVLDW